MTHGPTKVLAEDRNRYGLHQQKYTQLGLSGEQIWDTMKEDSQISEPLVSEQYRCLAVAMSCPSRNGKDRGPQR